MSIAIGFKVIVAAALLFLVVASVVNFGRSIKDKDFSAGVVSVFSFILGLLAFFGILPDLVNLI